MSIDEFINETNGHAYDMDGAYGVQCVDGIKKFVQDFKGESNFSCGNNWAYGLWVCYGSNGVEKYFNKHSYEEARKGDWIIWNKGSKEAPNSHVGMFIEDVGNGRVKTYGQSQNGIKAFNYCDCSKDGILGVLRLKDLENDEPTPTPTPPTCKYNIGDKVIINGQLYGDSQGNNPGKVVSNVTTTITRKVENAPYPYNTEGDLGWISEDSIQLVPSDIYPFNAVIKVGSQLYDQYGNEYNKAQANRNVTVQAEINGRYRIYGETFTPRVVYCNKDAIMR